MLWLISALNSLGGRRKPAWILGLQPVDNFVHRSICGAAFLGTAGKVLVLALRQKIKTIFNTIAYSGFLLTISKYPGYVA
ncbi:MAG: hypothetical protein ABI790_15950 [Betaproteobacteria bacterium]